MAAAAQARREAAVPRREEQTERTQARPATRRAPEARRRAAQRARFTRAFVIFVVCLSVLAAGRVALSFAVVQKSLQTDAVAREERTLTAQNAQLSDDLAQLSSPVRISHIAETQLGLVGADIAHITYIRVPKGAHLTAVAERP